MGKKITLQKKILSENDRLASEIRDEFRRRNIASLNLVSSPGSGKTSLLSRTLTALQDTVRIAVIVGDVETENDAERLRRTGAAVIRPITTGGACHLDARMVQRSLDTLELDGIDLVCIENVGNLVCPASFDLGEDMKVVLMSTTEGDDKPLKYPAMFRRSSLLVINKIDLLGFSEFDIERAKQNALRINPNLETIELSCRTGEGLDTWYAWLRRIIAQKKGA